MTKSGGLITRLTRIIKRIMIIIISLLLLLAAVVAIYMQQDKFGKLSAGDRLARIRKSPNYKDGSFVNLNHTPQLTEGASYYSVLKEFLFYRSKRGKPMDSLPSQKTDLHRLPADSNMLIWMGHSTYFMQIDGKKILVDPVLSGAASPLAATTRSFKGSDIYSTEDLPVIDYLFISHDHYDHLDYETIIKLKPKIRKVICGLGVGAHFEHWGFDMNSIIERDWYDQVDLDTGFTAYVTPARHFSGRGFRTNKSLWASYVLQTPGMKVFIGGDSGYDTYFAEIGKRFGPFDLAILECGQYDKSWKYIHMLPDEVLKAATDLGAKRLMPVHWGKFQLGNHAWDDPILSITGFNKDLKMKMVTPLIGETVRLQDTLQTFLLWWEKVK